MYIDKILSSAYNNDRKNKKSYHLIRGGYNIEHREKDIEQYISEVKEAVENGRYRIARNDRRQDNVNLFLDYVINEAKAKEIILTLTAMDFSEILQNKHQGYEHEKVYVFGKDVLFLERNGTEEKCVKWRWQLWQKWEEGTFV